MEWLGLLLVGGASAYFFGRYYLARIDRIEAEKAREDDTLNNP